MARELKVEIIGDAASLERALGRATSSSSKFADGMRKAALPAAGALGLIAVGAKKAADDASNLGESVNAVNVVFGEAAGKITAFSKVAAKEAGLSARAFNELVTPIGASLQNVGFSANEAADASINLGKRAADMASVFNVDVSEALAAIQAGLRGEADPLERFGVGLSAAAVTSKALTMGLADTAAGLDENDKGQARLALLMEQTDKVAGDFKNTSDQLANSQRVNAAEAENQRAKFGQGLLPVMQTYQGLLRGLTGFLGGHTTATKILVGVAAGLALGVLAVNAAMKVYQATLVVARAAQIAFNFVMAANPVGLVVIAIAGLALGLVVAYKKSETFRDIVNGVFNAVRNTVMSVIAAILGGVDKFLGGIQRLAEVASKLPGVGDKFRGIADAVGNAREKVRGLQTSIDNLKSKDITISTTLRTVYQERREVLPGTPIGRRARGGPVRAGQPYIVGEERPELFIPDVDGQIIPRVPGPARGGGVGGGGSPIVVENHLWIELDGEQVGVRVRRQLQRRVRSLVDSTVIPSQGKLGLS